MNTYEKALQALDLEFGTRYRLLSEAKPIIEAHEVLSQQLTFKGINTTVVVTTTEAQCEVWLRTLGNAPSQVLLIQKLADWKWNVHRSEIDYETGQWFNFWRITSPEGADFSVRICALIDVMHTRTVATQGAAA